jgi:hypothetical protein
LLCKAAALQRKNNLTSNPNSRLKAEIIDRKDLDTKAWDLLVSQSQQGSIFSQTWYIDTLLGDWKSIHVFDDGQLTAVMPLNLQSKYLMKQTRQPVLARYWGLIARENIIPKYKRYNYEESILKSVFEALPDNLMRFDHYFHPNFDFPLPFLWNGYELHSRYTYIIDLKKSLDEIESGYARGRNSRIPFQVKLTKDLQSHLQLFKLNEDAGKKILDKQEIQKFERLVRKGIDLEKAEILEIHSEKFGYEGSAVLFRDITTTHFFSSLLHPSQRSNKAMPRLTKECIRHSHGKSDFFDFKGSVMPGIEYFFRSFGATLTPYLHISRSKWPAIWLE